MQVINIVLFEFNHEKIQYKEKLRQHYSHDKLKYDVDEIHLSKRYIIV